MDSQEHAAGALVCTCTTQKSVSLQILIVGLGQNLVSAFLTNSQMMLGCLSAVHTWHSKTKLLREIANRRV